MAGRTIFEEDLKSLAEELIERYPMVPLSEIKVGWPCAIAIHVPDGDCPDTPKVIIRDSYQKVRAFETACQRAKDARITFSSPVSAPAMAEAI